MMNALSLQQSSAAPASPPTPAAPDDRATEFTAVESGEHYSGSTLLVEAYAAIWVILMVWIFMLWRKQASLSERLDGLERTIDRAAAAVDKKASKAKA
jgi:CcmD family protein